MIAMDSMKPPVGENSLLDGFPRSVKESITEAAKLTVPTWPLQNTVAVNPFWNLRDRAFSVVEREHDI